MAGQAQRVHAECADVEVEPAAGLHRIGVQRHTYGVGNRSQFDEGLHRAHLVVGVVHRDQRGVGAQRPGEGRGVDAAVSIHG